ncbi:PA1414 family protein [Pseudomonas sp. M30-35]|nr:PA1414 family protein [Pseudomonas sp. M30-35]
MIAKMQNAFHDLLVALGLLDRPKLQPIPVRNDDSRRPREPRRQR